VKVGEYQKEGQTKGRYENIGVVMEDDSGREFILLKRTFNPAGVPGSGDRDSIVVSIFNNDGPGQNQGGHDKPQAHYSYNGGQSGYGGGGYQNQNSGGYGGNQRQQGPPQGQQNMNYGGGNYQNQAKGGFKDDDPYDDQIPF